MITIDPLMAALVLGVVLALIYGLLHIMGPRVPRPEPEARPFYYGIGFGCFLVMGWIWAAMTGYQVAMFALTIIGGVGGMGMLTMYLWDEYQRRQDTTDVDTAAGGPPHVQP